MRILALDYGSARCGAAICDPTETVTRPLPALEPPDAAGAGRLAAEESAEMIVVGLPVGLAGAEGRQASLTREFCAQLAARVAIPVETYDERFTTVLAEQSLRGGASGDPDSLAAAHLLDSYLSARAASGR